MTVNAGPSDTPAVSVVIPAFNHVRWIDECLDSVLTQDVDGVELVVIDDGSTDGTLERLKARGPAIRLLQQRGGRQARARNLGVQASRGDFIAFLDSDDRMRPGRLRAALETFSQRPDADLVWGDFQIMDAEGKEGRLARWPGQPDFPQSLLRGNPICNATVMLRRSALERLGGFDERIPRACDGHAWYRLASSGGTLVHCGAVLADYRLHGSNDSAGLSPMDAERDVALQDAVQAWWARGWLATPAERERAWRALVRQRAFAAARQLDALAVGPRWHGGALALLASRPGTALWHRLSRWRAGGL